MKIYVNKIENRTTFNIKTGYYLQILTSETMKLLGSTKNKITKDKNGWKCTTSWNYRSNFSPLSIMIINEIQELFMYLFQIDHLAVC